MEHSVQRKIPHITILACIAASIASSTLLIIAKMQISEKLWFLGVRKKNNYL